MYVAFEDLPELAGRVAMVDGCFDPLHAGHIEYFRAAAERLGVPLLCNVAPDSYVRTKRGGDPLLAADHRQAIIDAIRFITYTHGSEHSTAEVLAQLRPKYYVKGNDWAGGLPPEQVAQAARCGYEIVLLDTVRDSSARILERYVSQATAGPAAARVNP